MTTRHLVASHLLALALLLSASAARAQSDSAIQWAPDMASAREIAQVQQRPLLIHFWSPSCIPCLRLEKEVFSRPEVAQTLNQSFIAVKVNTEEHPELAEEYGVRSIPTDVVALSNGQVIYKTISPAKAETYVEKLTTAARSPAAQIAQRLAQQQPQSPATPAGPPANPTLPSKAELANSANQLAQQQAAQWGQQLNQSQQAIQQQAQAWQTNLENQAQQFANQTTDKLNGQLQSATQAADQQLDPVRQQLAQRAEQASQFAQTVQNSAQQFQAAAQQVPAAGQQLTNNDRPSLEQFNPFVTSAAAATGVAGLGAAAASPAAPPAQMPAAQTMPPAPAMPAAPNFAAAEAPTAAPPAAQNWAPPSLAQAAATTAMAANAVSQTTPAVQDALNGQFARNEVPPAGQTPLPAPPAAQFAPGAGQTNDILAAAAPRTNTAANQPPQLGLEGYCPVTLLEEERWQAGDKRFGAIHRGRTYIFATKKNQLLFLANPDRYSPVLAGIDPVILTSEGRAVEGKRAHGLVYKDEVHGEQIYLFSSEQTLHEFYTAPKNYAVPVRQAMMEGTISRFVR